MGGKPEPKAEIPRPPPANTLPSEPKKSFLPPPDAKLTLPSLSLPKIPEAEKKPVPPTPANQPQQPTPSLELPKISLPKVDISLPVSTPEKPKVTTPPPPKKEETKLPSLSLPSISIPKPEQPKTVASTPPPKPAKKKNDPYVFTEAALKEYIQKDKPAVTELDKQQEEERKRREAENARIAQLAGPLFPERSEDAPAVKSVPPKKVPTLSVPKISPAATKAPPKKQEAVKVPPVKGRPTFSLFGMGSAPPKPKTESASEAPIIARTTPTATAPRAVPTISKWKFDPSDNSISGFISGSSAFKDGEPITTSAIVGEASSNTVIRTKSGSRYFLGDEETSRGGGGIFGFLGGGGSGDDSVPVASPVSDNKSKAVDTLAVRLEAQRKRDEEKQRLAAEAESKKAEQEAARRRAADEAAAKREQQALARKQAEEESRRIAEEKKAAQEEARQQAAAKKAEQDAARQRAAEEARIKREKEAEAKRLAQEAARKKAEAAAKKVAAPKQQEDSPRPTEPRPTFSLFGLGGGAAAETESASTPVVKSQPLANTSSAPRGVPTISKWTLNSDNTISGFISGSSAFNNNDPVTTSAIVGQASSNTVVRTKSGSR